jgi:antitoxin ParD1/3/4
MEAMVATNVHLTPELEHFARQCVEGGRYNNVSEVVRSGLRLLQESEDRRLRFQAMLHVTEAEADRDGTFSVDEVVAEINGMIGASR